MPPSIYSIARQRTAERIEQQIASAMTIGFAEDSPAAIKRKQQSLRKKAYRQTEHGRNVARKATKKYRKTEKGRATNRKSCRRHYYKNHDQSKARVQEYKKNFFEKYGCHFGSWQYWRKKLVNGNCTESDVPEAFATALEAFKNGVFNRHKESE